MNSLESIGKFWTYYITIPLCIIGLVLCWVWGRKGEKNGVKSKHKKSD